MVWNEQEIRKILSRPVLEMSQKTGSHENRYLVYRMLQALYERQTASEQATDTTKYRNGVGFNSADARLLSDMAKRSQRYKNLTPKQATYAGKRMQKYVGQLVEIAQSKSGPVGVQTTLPEGPHIHEEPTIAGCSYCGEQGHEKEQCDIYWGDEFGRVEAAQEQEAFRRKMNYSVGR